MTMPGDPTDPVEARLARLRDATAASQPSATFVARVLATAATTPPSRPSVQLTRAWWSVPIAAMVAAATVLWALHARRPVDDSAARDIEAALAPFDGEVSP